MMISFIGVGLHSLSVPGAKYYTRNLSKCLVLGDLIFLSWLLNKKSHSQAYGESFSEARAEKAKDQNKHFGRLRVYIHNLSKCLVLGALIFLSWLLNKKSHSQAYGESFSKARTEKAKDQNKHFGRLRVYTPRHFKMRRYQQDSL